MSLTDEHLLTFVLLSLLKPDAISEKEKMERNTQKMFFEVCLYGNEILNLFFSTSCRALWWCWSRQDSTDHGVNQ